MIKFSRMFILLETLCFKNKVACIFFKKKWEIYKMKKKSYPSEDRSMKASSLFLFHFLN